MEDQIETTETGEQAETQTDVQAEETAGTETQATEGAETQQPVKSPNEIKLEREVGRLGTLLKRHQDGHKATDTTGSPVVKSNVPTGSLPGTSATADHPALRGLPVDEPSGLVNYNGAWVEPGFAIQQEDMRTQLQQLSDKLTAREQSETEAKEQAEVDAAMAEVFKAVESHLTELRTSAFPNLSKEDAAEVDDYLIEKADNLVTARLRDGEQLTADVLSSVTKEALGKAKRLFGLFGAKQLQTNAEYRDQHRVKPGGVPGATSPKPIEKMTKRELEEASNQWAKMAEQQSRGG